MSKILNNAQPYSEKMDSKRNVCVVVVDRANYGRLRPVMQAIDQRPELELQVLAAGTMVLERFGLPVEVMRRDGFTVHGEIFIELEGSTPMTMAKSVGFGIVEFASEFQRLKPDIIVLIGDRYEALSAAVAAAYMNIPLLHIQGGEVSGSIDESARHAITKLAQYHYPATQRSSEYIMRMGERAETVLGVGCPSSDIARTLDPFTLDPGVINAHGLGTYIDVDQPFLLVVFHPTTTEYGEEQDQMAEVLEALANVAIQTLLLWPNIDAGSNRINKRIRIFRNYRDALWLHTLVNLTPEDYMKVLARATCAVGNSSSFVRDASFLGTPVVLIGNRQNGRETAEHVQWVPCDREAVTAAIRQQLVHGRYPPSTLYGDGYVSERIAEALAQVDLYVQKRISYPEEVEA